MPRVTKWAVGLFLGGLLLTGGCSTDGGPGTYSIELNINPLQDDPGAFRSEITIRDVRTGETVGRSTILSPSGERAQVESSTSDGRLLYSIWVLVDPSSQSATYEAKLASGGVHRATVRLAG